MKPVLEVESLSKSYRAQGTGMTSLRDSFQYWWRQALLKDSLPASLGIVEKFWALEEISFQVQQGEAVGIIGKNGAGKSTLLKILARLTEPSAGRALIRGRVASLLEVGSGFHPDLSGRENVFLNGTFLGMKRAEIEIAFDEIVAFAEVEKFIDLPIKHFSKGMYTRLAFSVAAHLNADILLMDEILDLGDAFFQERALEKMRAQSKQGKTILFVSHHEGHMRALCDRSLVLESGKVLFDGSLEEGLNRYLTTVEV